MHSIPVRFGVPLLALATCIAGCASRMTPTAFPGDAGEATAPEGRGAIVGVDRPEPDAKGNLHSLYFRTPSGQYIAVLSYSRHAEVLWSRDGSLAAITDARTPEDAVCLIFSANSWTLTDTTPQLEASLPWLAQLRRTGHCTIHALRWRRNGNLDVRIDGSAPGLAPVNNLIATVKVAGTIP